MPLKLSARLQFTSGTTIYWSIERLSDGTFFDFNDNTFKSSGWTTKLQQIVEGTGDHLGSFSKDLTTTTAQFTDGRYCLNFHDHTASDKIVSMQTLQMRSGSDAGDPTASKLASSGLDAITIESGVNARQALSPILAAAAGNLSGAGTGTIIIKAGNDAATTRITCVDDGAGNRTTVTLALPT